MQYLISNMTSLNDLKAFRRYAGSVLAENLGSPIKGRKLDELVAQLAGAKDWNTAVGIINKQSATLPEPNAYNPSQEIKGASAPNGLLLAWDSVISGLVAGGYISGIDKDLMMDEAVDELVGTSEWIADNVNNQGQFVQLVHINRAQSLPLMWRRISEATGITEDDLKACVEAARTEIMAYPDLSGQPFDIQSVTKY